MTNNLSCALLVFSYAFVKVLRMFVLWWLMFGFGAVLLSKQAFHLMMFMILHERPKVHFISYVVV